MCKLAALCTLRRSIFLRPFGDEQVANMARSKFAVRDSDHLNQMDALTQFIRAREKSADPNEALELNAWCAERYLNRQALEEAAEMRVLVGFHAKDSKIPPTAAGKRSPALVKSLARAFCNNIAYYDGNGMYRTVNTHVMARLPPHSCLLGKHAKWVVFTRLEMKGRGGVEMDAASAISLDCLLVSIPSQQELV